SGKLHDITPRSKSGPTAVYGGGRGTKDGRSIFLTTDKDGEFRRLVRVGLDSGETTMLSGGIPWGVGGFDLSDDGELLAFFVNEDGFSRLYVIRANAGEIGATVQVPKLPAGVAGGLDFRPGSHEVGFQISWAHSPSDVYSFDVDKGRLERWTAS